VVVVGLVVVGLLVVVGAEVVVLGWWPLEPHEAASPVSAVTSATPASRGRGPFFARPVVLPARVLVGRTSMPRTLPRVGIGRAP
jgi:hypothetical protein